MDTGRTHLLTREQWLPRPIEQVFAFFADAMNLQAITPSWLEFSVITPAPIVMGAGTVIDYRLRWHAIPLRWTTLIEVWDPPQRFVDAQIRGPYRLWRHSHTFQVHEGGTLIRDEVCYRLPLGPLGDIVHRVLVRRDLERIFDERVRRIHELLGPGGHADR